MAERISHETFPVAEGDAAGALAALRSMQAAFASSGISEEELQEGGRNVREDIYRQRYQREGA